MRTNPPWTWFVAAAVGLLVVTLGASAALAPSVGDTDDTGDGRSTLVGSHGGGPGFHEHGSVYRLDDGSVTWREDSADSVFEVEELANGTVLVAFADGGVSDCGPYEAPCGRTGYRIVDPEGPTVLSEYSFPVRDIKNSEVHSAEPLPDGSVAMVDMDQERLVVVENGSTAWEWRAESFYDAPEDPTRTDWLHINDVDYLGEDRFLVSVRNANQLLVIERGTGVVEVVNEDRTDDDSSCTKSGQLEDYDGDGDVRCGDSDVLNHQHNPQWLSDEAVLVADSDNDRVVELHRDDDGRWEPAWALYEAEGVDFAWPRDADRLPNGNTLVTDTMNRRLVEVDRNGSTVWSSSTERVPYEADRLGVDDSAPHPAYGGDGTVESPGERDVFVLSTLVFLAHAAVPALPFWFAEPQMAVTLLSVGLLVGAAVQWYRKRGETER